MLKRLHILIVTLLIIPGCGPAFAGDAGTVILTPVSDDQVTLSGLHVQLHDVFSVSGDLEESGAALPAMTLLTFRKPGERRTLGRYHLDRALKEHGYSGNVTVKGEFPLIVESKSAIIPRSKLQSRIDAYLLRETGRPDGEIEWDFITDPEIGFFQGTTYEIKFSHRGMIRPGRLALQCELTNGGYNASVVLPVQLRLMGRILVASRDIQRGEKITGENTITERQSLDLRHSKYALSNLQEVTGLVARANIREGEVLTNTMLDRMNLVQSGENVRLVLQYGSVRIESVGKAIGRGGITEQIRVREQSSGKVLTGTIIGENLIEIQALRNL